MRRNEIMESLCKGGSGGDRDNLNTYTHTRGSCYLKCTSSNQDEFWRKRGGGSKGQLFLTLGVLHVHVLYKHYHKFYIIIIYSHKYITVPYINLLNFINSSRVINSIPYKI